MRHAAVCLAVFAAVAAHAQTLPVFRFDASGSFTLMQLSDIQDNDQPKPRVAAFIDQAVKRCRPQLIVLTGDNTDCCSRKGAFEKSASAFVDIFKVQHTPFAVAFGNHDSEKKGDGFYTRDEQYALYKQLGGDCFVDYDVPALSGTGSGVIPIRAASGDAVRFNVFLMDSGDYVKGGYDGIRIDQIQWYESVSGKTPCLWFQHIPVPDFFDTGLLVAVPTNTPNCYFHTKGEYAGKGYLLDATRAAGLLREVPSPTRRVAYTNAAHTYQGRTLYASWLKTGNLAGAYFGHDHPNTFDGTDANGIRLGYTKAATLCSYNDNNPGCRVFTLKADGTYTTQIVTESDLKNAASK
ncbi:MAG TPA: metallophosphoesterase [Kiritimatiellia bacterium]|nr:metallophosphoesterase [Kiritimatiellia bacterium]HPS07129.1 metallophosphoesterase [Kiritimatiellia bacterium]